jgi:hypothetical protein
VRPFLHSISRKLFGETRTVPLGVTAAVVLALLLQTLLPRGDWQWIGGFAFAAALIATLLFSLHTNTSRRNT